MTFNHPVWNQLDVKAGQVALAKFGPTPEARARRIADSRERAWFSANEILYSGADSKPERDARYATAMQQLTTAYPKDDEAQLFYALALLGKSEGVRDVPPTCRPRRSRKRCLRGTPTIPARPTTGFMRWTTRSTLRERSWQRVRCRKSRPVRRTRNICAPIFSSHWECGMT